jgi:hypothetical protein
MADFSKQIIDPTDLIKKIGFESVPYWIKYDPDLWQGDYDIIRGSKHDGTGLFTWQMYWETLEPILNMASCHKDYADKTEIIKTIFYTIGPMRVSTVYGQIEINGHKMFGERQRTRMSVKCEYEFK